MEVGAVNHQGGHQAVQQALQQAPKTQSEDSVKDILNASQNLKSADRDQDLKLQNKGPKEEGKGNAVDELA